MDEPILYLGDRGFLKRYGSPYSAQPNPEYPWLYLRRRCPTDCFWLQQP